ncbi:hypothetical protein J3459_010549 [Metarhizium acridum]|nr:hypothetical protein J3459_010549 [Metarhizium acridum]
MMDVDWIDNEAGLTWLGNMGECNTSSDEYPYQHNEAFGSTPVSYSNPFNAGKESVSPCVKGSGSEFSQETDEFPSLPYPYLVPDLPLDHCQPAPVLEPSTCSNSNDASPHEEALLLKPRQEPCDQSDLRQSSNNQRSGSMSTAMDSTEVHLTKDRRPRKRRKRAACNTNLDDDDGCSNNSPAADEKNHRNDRLGGCHNQVEKNYRSRLNNEFQLLLDALADCTSEKDMMSAGFAGCGAKNQSKGSTLRLARRRLLALHTENCLLSSELRAMRHAWTEWQMAWSGNNPVTY